jgi:ABC-type dipeptide/oligopeptide/nickel transport system ATPase component
MYAGKVVEQLAASELGRAQHPYTRGLLNCMPKIGADRHPRRCSTASRSGRHDGGSLSVDRLEVVFDRFAR